MEAKLIFEEIYLNEGTPWKCKLELKFRTFYKEYVQDFV